MLFLVLAAVLLVLAPWIINQTFVKDRIEAAAAKAVGGRVTYERAGLSILPRPHLTIRGLHLAIPGAVSGNLASLDLYAELPPLLTGIVRLTKVVIDHPDIMVARTGHTGNPDEPEPSTGRAPEQAVATALGGVALMMPNMAIVIRQGKLAVTENGQPSLAFTDVDAQIGLLPSIPDANNGSAAPGAPFRIIGDFQGVIANGRGLPGPVGITVRRFEALPRTISFSDAQARLLDTSVVVSGRMDDYLTTLYTANLTLDGTIGPDAMQWIRTLSSLPPEMTVRTPVTLSKARFRREQDGTLRLEGIASVQNGPTPSVDLLRDPDRFSVRELRIGDKESQAVLTFTFMNNRLELTFSGSLSSPTLNSLFEHERFRFGWVRGDVRARIALDRPLDSTARGALQGERLALPFALTLPVTIDRVSLNAAGRTVTLNPLVITLGAKTHTVRGDVTASAGEWLLNLKIDGLELEPLQTFFAPNREEVPNDTAASPRAPSAPVRATVRLDTDYLTFGRWSARPVRGEISFRPDRTHLKLTEAGICGIRVSGAATIQPEHLELDMNAAAKHRPLAADLNCLSRGDLGITGAYDLSGAFTSRGKPSAWFNNLRGTVAFTAKDGRIHHEMVTVKMLGYLHGTELLKGTLPDPEKEGLSYQSLAIRGKVKNSSVEINEAILLGPVLTVTGQGSINLSDRTMDTVYLVAPFPKADTLLRKIPLLGDTLGGTLVTIPVRVKGPYEDPTVTAMAPGEVADELGSMMKRTLELPFKIINPILPKRQPETIQPDS
jgi:hypothetical protein